MRVEVILLSAKAGRLMYRSRSAELTGHDVPDDLASDLAMLGDPHGVLHSTSWRFDDGRIVLTYAALPDPNPRRPTRTVGHGQVIASGDAQEPDPHADLDEVAAHAVRHLAFLAETDPAVSEAIGVHTAWRRLLNRHRPDVAGQATPSAGAPVAGRSHRPRSRRSSPAVMDSA